MESPRDRTIRALRELSAQPKPPQVKFGKFYSAYQIGQRARVTPDQVRNILEELVDRPGYSTIVLPGNNIGYRFDPPFHVISNTDD
jgi:hypothetical protein